MTNRGALNLSGVVQTDHQNHHDDTLLHALDGAWSLIFSGTLESDLLPIPLTLATPSMTQPLLGNLVAFAVAASPSCGSGRILALAVQILSQLREYTSNMVNLKPALTVCLKNDLPLVRPIQRKQEKSEADIPPTDLNHEPNTKMPCQTTNYYVWQTFQMHFVNQGKANPWQSYMIRQTFLRQTLLCSSHILPF